MTEISGKVAVVTGAGSGLGRGLAMALAAEGARVILADIMKDNAEAVAAEIKKAGGSALAVSCDVSERASVRKMKAEANEAFGRVSLLFANAGATSFDRMDGISDSEVDWIIQVNLMGVVNCVQTFLPDMIAAREGHIVGTASPAGLIPSLLASHAPYAAAKLGVIGLILNLRLEIAEFGLEATVLCPSNVDTKMKDSPKYRPARFGGPFEKAIIPPADFKPEPLQSPEEAAQMVLLAVRRNRPMVITGHQYRDRFIEEYVNIALQAFDDAAAFAAARLRI